MASCFDRTLLVDGLAEHVHDAAEGAFAHGHRDRGAGVDGFHATDQTVGAAHGHRANAVIAEELLNLSSQSNVLSCGVFALDPQSVVDARQLAGGEFNVEHRTNDLADDSFRTGCGFCCCGHGLKRWGGKAAPFGPGNLTTAVALFRGGSGNRPSVPIATRNVTGIRWHSRAVSARSVLQALATKL